MSNAVRSSSRRRCADMPYVLDTRKIKSLRIELGLTQQQAADLAGIPDRQRWNKIEKGTAKNITLETLGGVARALGVSPRDLLLK